MKITYKYRWGLFTTKREIELMDFSGEVEELVKILENLTW